MNRADRKNKASAADVRCSPQLCIQKNVSLYCQEASMLRRNLFMYLIPFQTRLAAQIRKHCPNTPPPLPQLLI